MQCRICEHFPVSHYKKVRYRSLDYSICICPKCRAIFLPRTQGLAGRSANLDYYSEEELEKAERVASNLPRKLGQAYWETRINLLKTVMRRNGNSLGEETKILDIGCHVGNFLERCPMKWSKAGIELSPVFAEKARKKGFSVYEEPLGELNFGSNSFDAITLFNVIEHFDDPKKEVQAMYSTLKKSGVVLVATPDVVSYKCRLKELVRWRKDEGFGVFWMDVHQFFFTPRSLDALMELCGFKLTFAHNSDGRARWTSNEKVDMYIQKAFYLFQRNVITKKIPIFDLMFRYYKKR